MDSLQLAVTKLCAVAITSFLLDGVCPEHSRHSVDKCPCLKLKNCSKNYVWLLASFQKAVLIIHWVSLDVFTIFTQMLCALFHTLRHYAYNMQQEHCCLFVIIESDWIASLRPHCLRTCRNMSTNTRRSSISVWHYVQVEWMLSGYFLIWPHICWMRALNWNMLFHSL